MKHSNEIDTRIKIPLEHYLTRAASPDRLTGGSKSRTYQAGLPVVSVCTIVRNGKDTLARAIESVKAQTYPNIEYVMIDGASNDGTLDVIRHYDSDISFWMSEADGGPEDGLSKALAFTTGDFVAFCMGDDQLEPDTAAVIVEAMTRNDCDFVYGDVIRDDRDGNYILTSRSPPDFADKVMIYFPIASPSFAVSRKFISTVGGFFPNHYNTDYQWFVRAHVAGLKGVYDPRLKIHFSAGGFSNFAARDIYLAMARTAVAFGGNRWWAWGHAIKELSRYYLRSVVIGILPASAFEKLRPLIRKLRGIT